MAKLGKFATGMKQTPPMSKNAGDGNKGYDQRTNMMGDNGMTKHEKLGMVDKVTAQGNPSLAVQKRITRKT